ncbi:polyhydroxyalkanoic acid system family protein [Ideonella margarita]|uniref:Polyhydroxyalkanoic acid system family protein n=1 Tax=Ideonella margarita TaxID=2984191 RepID=A0ABU9C432_9BURK
MSDIRIRRDHQLGLQRARKVAWKWAEHAEKKLDMTCTVIEGDTSDKVEFKRSGASGTLIVTGDHFDMEVKLGFLFKAFASQVEAEASKQLDAALAKEAARKA